MNTEEMLKKRANSLCFWRGGGYDGCIWEPNMGFVDADGIWHPTISTGSGAIDDAETLADAIEELEKVEAGELKDNPWDRKYDGFRIMPMTQESVDWFCDNVRIDYVAYFVDKINDSLRDGFQMKCTHCGKRFSSMDLSYKEIVDICANAGYYRGDGGIGIICTDLLCDDCRYDLIESVHEGDWVYVCGNQDGIDRRKCYEVLKITDDGDYEIIVGEDEDGNELTKIVSADDCRKQY